MVKRISLGLFVAAVAFAVITLPACQPKPVGRPTPPAGEAKGDLAVVHVSPQGAVAGARDTDQIVVIFDHTMAPLEPLPIEDSGQLLKIEPSFAGKYRWMGTKALAFTPKDRFPFGTQIKITVPAGLRSQDGFELKKDFAWSFETQKPYLVRSLPAHEAKQIKLDQPVYLVFSQAIDRAKASGFLAFAGAGAEGKTHEPGFTLQEPTAAKLDELGLEAKPERALLLVPREKLRPDFAYSVEIKPGLPGREGPLGLEKAAALRFETFKTFAFEGMDADDPLPPGEQLVFHFSNRVPYKDFVKAVTFEPKVEIPDYYQEWDHGNTDLWLSLPFAPETAYAVRVPADLKDEFGNTLGREASLKFKTGPYKKAVNMTTGQGVLESYLDPIYPISAVNADKVRVMGAALSKDEIIPLLKGEKVFYANTLLQPRPSFYGLDTVKPLNLPRNKRQLVPVSLAGLLEDKHGLVFLQLDTFSEEEWERYPKAMVQVTEMAVTGKFSPDNDLIWVTGLKDGLPVAEAEVEIRDENNQVRWRGRTDKDGKAQAPGWKALGIKPTGEWTKPEQWVFARKGTDVAFASSEWGTGIDAYRFNIEYDWSPEPERLRGYVFSERGIYRAGETVHLKGLIRAREKGRWMLPGMKSVDCEITNPFQASIFKGKAQLDDYGSFSLDLETKADAALGYYNISVKLPPSVTGGKSADFSGSFRVEAFRPAEFEVHLRAQKDAFVFGEPFQAEIRSNYLYGGAMANQRAEWTLRLNPTSFDPPGRKGYIFGTDIDLGESDYSENSRLLASGATPLDLDGKLAVNVPLVAEKETTSVMAALEATVTSTSRKSISNRIQTVIHRGEYYIGVKPKSAFLKKGDNLAAEIISVQPDGGPAPDKKLTVKLLRREWRSARKAGVGGRYEWVSEKTDTEIASRSIRTANDPVEAVIPVDKAGFYVLTAEGQDGRKNKIVTATYVYVTGSDYVAWERQDDDALELVPDADSYKPGETARILIKSPYEKAKALITVERESIIDARVVDIVGSAVPVDIPITADHIPNVFISVLLVQGRTAGAAVTEDADVGKPQFKIGYAALHVDPSQKKLAVEVATDKPTYKPRDKVKVSLKVRDAAAAGAPASLTVAVVDVGVLNLIGYQTPDPFAWYYGEKPLSVQTADSRIHVVGQRHYGEKGESAGGGGDEAAAASGLSEVELRGDFKTTAYWNPSLPAGADGSAEFEFTLPDNLTTFRVMVVAQTKDSAFGRQDASFKVSKPLLLLPSGPRFARVGDAFQAGVVINNYSGRKGSVVMSLDAQGLVLKDKPERTFDLAVGESREILFALEAEKEGKARLAVRAKMGPDADGLEYGFPVQTTRGTETVATFDQTTGPKEERISLPDTIQPQATKLEVTAAASALTGLKGCIDYLTYYPYLCLEQKTSSILPYLVAPKLIEDFNLSSLEPKAVKELVRRVLKDMDSCQRENGGYSLWPDSARESPYATVYAVFAQIKAREAGYDINEDRLNQAANYLRQLLSAKPGDSPYPYGPQGWLTTQAYALYDLALLKKYQPAAAELLFRARGNMSLFGRSLLTKAIHVGDGSAQARDTLLQEMLNLIKVEASQAHFEEDPAYDLSWIYSSNARTTGLVLQTLLETGRRHPLSPAIARWLVGQRKAGRWHSTQENFFVFYSLNEYYKAFESERPDFRAEIAFAGKTILKESFQAMQKSVTAIQSLADVKPGANLPVKIDKTGPGTLYYGLRLTYAPKRALEARDEGFAVYKTLTTLDGKPLTDIRAGQIVLVTLEVLAPKESLFVVVDDPLPAGFEAVNPTFETESAEKTGQVEAIAAAENDGGWWRWWGFNHIEMRDDRVLLFADSLPAGLHKHRYLARALTPGVFALPGSKAEMMYAPETFGRSGERTVKIVK
ncbi:MAG: MG2 domain-containing protein [Candidatus Aminicenantes bacterium]|nr:MG2 domain-containing protein [Candidatus Aminicenantes bacterium]